MSDLDGDGFEDIVSVHEADIVYDGRPEVIAANKGDQNAGSGGNEVVIPKNISIFVLPRNPLDGVQWREQVLGKALIPTNSETVDLDRDGDPDVVAGSRGERRILWFENLGDTRFAEHDIPISGLPPDSRITGFNMDYADSDGDRAMATGTFSGLLISALQWLRKLVFRT